MQAQYWHARDKDDNEDKDEVKGKAHGESTGTDKDALDKNCSVGFESVDWLREKIRRDELVREQLEREL